MNDKETKEKYRRAIAELEQTANNLFCDHCGCLHSVRLHIGSDLQVTPIYRSVRPCQEYMRDLMSEIRALQKRMDLPENIC